MTRKPIFARLATEGRLKNNQSALYQWFIKHHNQFAAVLVKIGRPGWQSIADELSAEGLTMKDGKPITAAYARVTWWRAHKAYDAIRPPRPPARLVPVMRRGEVAQGVRSAVVDTPVDNASVANEPPPRKFQFGGPATLRGHTPAPPPVDPPEPAPPHPVQDVDEVVARLLGKPRSKSQPD